MAAAIYLVAGVHLDSPFEWKNLTRRVDAPASVRPSFRSVQLFG